MQLRIQSTDSFSGEEVTEDINTEFTGDAIRDYFNREIAAMGCPVSGLFTLSHWDVTNKGTVATFTLKGPEHFLVGIVYTVFV